MQYKTIVLELISQNPELHERLRASKTLLSTVDRYALLLKTNHQAWMERCKSRPEIDSFHLASEAMEIALQEFETALLHDAEPDEAESLSLEEAMAFVGARKPSV